MKETSTSEKQKTITIIKNFNLPISIVWKAWTEPENYMKWASPKKHTVASSSMDFIEGGKYLTEMIDPNGKAIWSAGTYKEIIPFKKIVFTDNFSDNEGKLVRAEDYNLPGEWAENAVVTVEFEKLGNRTRMKLQHEGIPSEIADDCEKGWQECFDKLRSNFKRP